MNKDRIWASLGLVFIAASVLMMIGGFFAGAAKGLLLNISLVCFLIAVTVLMLLNYKRNKAVEKKNGGEDGE